MQHNISPPSRVKRIKEKDKKEHRLPDFQYPDLPGRKLPHTVEMVEDVEKHQPAKQPKKLTLTNKFKIQRLHMCILMTLSTLSRRNQYTAMHYNSLRPRTSIHDPHIDQVQEVRKYIEHVVRVIGELSPLCTKLGSQNPSQPIIAVDVCPQQGDDSVDCGLAVCYIMRAHIYHEEIMGSLTSAEWCGLRDFCNIDVNVHTHL
ncbi:hypothetical protein CsSME_00032174 [Camellia sinensis var. sinensis]